MTSDDLEWLGVSPAEFFPEMFAVCDRFVDELISLSQKWGVPAGIIRREVNQRASIQLLQQLREMGLLT